MNKAKTNNKLKKLEKMKSQLSEFDLAIPGTVRVISLKCGKPSCACWKKKSARHGPYYFWDRKVDGKMSSKTIAEPMVPLLRKWINNRRKIEELLQDVFQLSQELVADMVDEEKTKE